MGRDSRRRKTVGSDTLWSGSMPRRIPRTRAPTVGQTTGKMSERLIAIAEPWTQRLHRPATREELAFIYGVAGEIWNASREPTEGAAIALNGIRGRLEVSLPELPRQAVFDLVAEIYERARSLYPGDPRLIAYTTVEDHGDGHCCVTAATVTLE